MSALLPGALHKSYETDIGKGASIEGSFYNLQGFINLREMEWGNIKSERLANYSQR